MLVKWGKRTVLRTMTDDGKSEAEQTQNEDDRYGVDKEGNDYQDDFTAGDDDSGFSTKASGRYNKGKSSDRDAVVEAL